jgi:TolA-binding protein
LGRKNGFLAATSPDSQNVLDGLISTCFFLSTYFLLGCTEQRQIRLIESAEQKIQAGQYLEGSNLLKKAAALNPDSKSAIRAVYKLGLVLEIYLRDAEGALFNYQEFIRLSSDPMSVYEVLNRMGDIYFEQQVDAERAIATYKKLISLNSESLERDLFYLRVAQSYMLQNKFDLARSEYQELLERYPKSQFAPRARFEVGNAYYLEGKYEIAIEALKEVVRQHPQSEQAAEAQFLMGLTLEHQGKHQNALQLYEGLMGHYSSPEVLKLRIEELKKRILKKS